jgi:hypothetical protein
MMCHTLARKTKYRCSFSKEIVDLNCFIRVILLNVKERRIVIPYSACSGFENDNSIC